MLGNALAVAKRTDTLYAVAAGLVGEGVTKELVAFDMLKSQLVSPDKVLVDPQAALPDRRILNGQYKQIAMVKKRNKATNEVQRKQERIQYLWRRVRMLVRTGMFIKEMKDASNEALKR